MIRTALEFIRKELENYIVEREQDPAYSPGNVVELKPLAQPGGAINLDDNMHITVMLVGVEEMRREGKRPFFIPADEKNFFRLQPPLELELTLLIVANNKHYETSLRDLTDVAAFFQANPVFDQQHYPGLNEGAKTPDTKPWQLIDRLSFRLLSLTFEQQNNLWSMLGSKYLPNIVYKMSLLNVFETRGKDKSAGIGEVNYKEN
ncbi:Protein of unknown function [Chitinophaga jiangningensis]|uniref:Pvc16 N-terminal domain-containing protein n=1 Tax=Chitinophaga jiangningensis TaxID=1419482 RepID=A0A1M7JW23_9BACT|nr:Pvc16 family protein [Chitinophaga jiangningensis]SHM57135.1 Protein of unknown function [Chitinophaga jiangningensis]